MKNLIQIVQVLNRYKRKHIDVLGNADSKSRFTEFYNLINEGKITTDEEAVKYFYEEKANPSSEKYRFFKSQFKDRLFNTLYFIDSNNPIFTDFQQAYYSAWHEWGAINILYRRGIIYAATSFAERLLTVCIKFEITDLVVPILEKLKDEYARQVGDKKKYQEFKDKFWYYKGVWDAEHQACDAFNDIRINYVKSTAFRPETSLQAQAALDKLEELRLKYDSFVFVFNYYLVKEAIYSAKNEWRNIIPVCDEALEYFRKKPFSVKNYIAIFLNQKVIALLMMRRFEECAATLEEALALQEEGNINWFKTMEKKMFLYFYTDNLKDAYTSYLRVRDTKEYKNLQGHNAEIWRLFVAYLYLGASFGDLPNVNINDKAAFDSFRVQKFLNEIPTFGQDKRGMNIPVLVIQIVLMVREQKYDMLIDRIEAIGKYLVRYVPKSDTANYRSNQFIKALIQMSKYGFQRKAVERNTKKIIEDMSNVPYDLVDVGYKIEVQPLERVWDRILSQLGNKVIEIKKNKIPL